MLAVIFIEKNKKINRFRIMADLIYSLDEDINTDYLVKCPSIYNENQEMDSIILFNGSLEIIAKDTLGKNELVKELKDHIKREFKINKNKIKVEMEEI